MGPIISFRIKTEETDVVYQVCFTNESPSLMDFKSTRYIGECVVFPQTEFGRKHVFPGSRILKINSTSFIHAKFENKQHADILSEILKKMTLPITVTFKIH